jgi:hypothetical protein
MDASQYVIGAVLKQGGHPVAYHSETLSDAKHNYSTYDKEFYSLVQALKQWRHYILGKETILHTDHHPLIFINSQTKIQEQCHLKWVAYIQQFHLVIKYKKGMSNQMVDLLSGPLCRYFNSWLCVVLPMRLGSLSMLLIPSLQRYGLLCNIPLRSIKSIYGLHNQRWVAI